MKENSKQTESAELRRQAEAKLSKRKKKTAPPPATESDTQRLAHELQVHQIELEMQNEELLQSRAQVEAGLRQYTDLYDFAPVGYFSLTRDGAIHQVNLAGANLLGVERGKLIKRRFGVFVSAQSRPAFSAFLEKVFSTSGSKAACEIALLKDGHEPLWAHIEVICPEDGQECRAVVVDITERKRAEEALRESEERWHFISQATYEGIVVHEQGTIVDVSETGARMVGYTREELIGKSILIFIHPDSVETVLKNVSSGAESPIEAIGLRKDGTTFHCELRGRNLTFQDRPVRVVVVRDITERKQAEEQLAASEAELRALFAGMTDVVIVYDADGRYIKIAPTNPINLYRPPDDMLGKTVHDILPKEQADYTVAKIGEALQTGQVVTGEYALQIGGKERWFAGSASRLSENTAVWVAHDITTRKRAEEQIQSQVETLGALYDLSRTLSEMEDFNAILDRVTRCAVESTHVTFARVLLLEQDDLVARAAFPVRVLDHALQVGQREPLADHPTCQRVLDENTPLVIQAGSPEAGDCASFFLGIAQTLCIIPLHVHEHPFGLLMLGEARDPAREPFTTEKLHLARSIGDQTISTFHRAALHEQTEKQVQRLAALREIDMAISSSFDLRVTLSIVLNQILMQLKVDAADVLLLNPFLQSLDYTAGQGFRTPGITHSHLRLSEGFAGKAALEHRLLHIPDLTQESGFVRLPLLAGENFIGYYAVPLVAKGQVKGVLEVFHRAPLNNIGGEWQGFLETLAGQAAIAIDNAQLFDGLQRSNTELVLAYDSTLEGWAKALELRDEETEGHAQRVAEMTVKLARAMKISEAELVHVRRGALLHDISKMGVPDEILRKPGPLSDEEWVVMRKHPVYAYEMLSPITYLRPALDIPYCHHEKWDGSGYPRKLQGEQIPLAARLFAVVDVWDALNSDRPYRKAWSKVKALEYIREQSGQHFDPQVVEAFLQMANGG